MYQIGNCVTCSISIQYINLSLCMKHHNANHSTLESMSQSLWYNRWTLSKFIPYLSGNILEVGCGFGSFTGILLRYGSVWAIDIDKFCITKTKKNCPSPSHIGYGNIETGKYFFRKHTFDSIVCMNVLEHIKNDEKALSNMYSILSPRGFLVLLVPSHPKLFGSIDKSIGHFRRYSRHELIKKVSDCGFSIIHTRRLNFLGAIGWWFAAKILNNTTVQEQKLHVFNSLAPLLLPLEDAMEPPIGTSILLIAQKI